MNINIKRIYDIPDNSDGYRVLVDRLWPRGISKEKAMIDYWAKEIAPTTEIRKEFGHEISRWNDFKKNYIQELQTKNNILNDFWKSINSKPKVTLLYGAKDTVHNNAAVLKEFLTARKD